MIDSLAPNATTATAYIRARNEHPQGAPQTDYPLDSYEGPYLRWVFGISMVLKNPNWTCPLTVRQNTATGHIRPETKHLQRNRRTT
jgi:hypothetical protein